MARSVGEAQSPSRNRGHRPRSAGERVGGDAGSVTAELAIGLTTVTLVTGALAGVGQVAATQLELGSAAGAAARVVARGGSTEQARAIVHDVAGQQAQLSLASDVPGGSPGGAAAPLVRVIVTREVTLFLPGAPSVTVRADAVSVDERSSAEGSVGS